MVRRVMLRFLALVLFLLPAMAGAEPVRVFAAASLKTALEEIAALYEAESGAEVTLVLAGTPALARQIAAGAPADVFVSASPEWMDEVAPMLVPGSRRDLLGNALVLVGQGGAPVEPGPAIIERLGQGHLAMALVDAVPAGQYGRAALASLGLWDALAPRVAQADNVRAALALVATGAAPLGIVYATDAAAEPRVTVLGRFDPETHPPIRYPAAAVTGRGEAFLDFLEGPAASEVFAAQGFEVLD